MSEEPEHLVEGGRTVFYKAVRVFGDRPREYLFRAALLRFTYFETNCGVLHSNWAPAWTWCPRCGAPEQQDGVVYHEPYPHARQ